MASVVKLNHGGFAELLMSDELRAIVAPHAEAVLAEFQATAPHDTGAYRDSAHIEHATTDRAVERVVVDDPKAFILEAKGGYLARAASAAGGS